MTRLKALVASMAVTGVLAAAPSPASAKEQTAWKLVALRAVEAGTTSILSADPDQAFPGGTLVEGLVLEAKVNAKEGAMVADGTFRLVLSAFKPNADMPGQKAGAWHVEGRWTIVDAKADPKALETRHNPYVLAGHLRATLPFSPADLGRSWVAAATLPPSLAAGRWVRNSKGTLSIDGKGAGDLALAVDVIAHGK